MKIKNNIMFLTLLPFYTLAIFSAKPAEAEHVFEPIKKQGTTADTSQHPTAEAFRIRNLDDAPKILHSSTDNDTQSGSEKALHEADVAFSNPTTPITIDQTPDPLAGISPETLEKIRALNANEPLIFTLHHTVDESRKEELKDKIEKVHAYEKIFEKELDVSQKTVHESMRLTPQEAFGLILELINEIPKNINDSKAILAEIAKLLKKAKTLNEKHEEAFLNRTQKEEALEQQPSLLPKKQEKADALPKIKESQEFKDTKTIILDFQNKLKPKLTSLDSFDILKLGLELINPLTGEPTEAKMTTLFKEASELNAQRIDEGKKAAKEQKAADEKAMREEAARKAFEAEKERVQALKNKLIENFTKELVKKRFLTADEIIDLDKEFETFVSINPDATTAAVKSSELLALADKKGEPKRLAEEKATEEKVKQIQKQDETLLDTVIKRISAINPKTADALRTLQSNIKAKIPEATVPQMMALRSIIDTVIDDLPKNAPKGKNIFGKETGKKWSKDQKKKAQEALDKANGALIEAFEEKATPPVSNGTETGITETQKAPQPDSKLTKMRIWLKGLFQKKGPKI